jgi:hypothetical protein
MMATRFDTAMFLSRGSLLQASSVPVGPDDHLLPPRRTASTETTTFRRKERPIRAEVAAAVRLVLGHVAPSRVVEPPETNVGRAVPRGAGVSIRRSRWRAPAPRAPPADAGSAARTLMPPCERRPQMCVLPPRTRCRRTPSPMSDRRSRRAALASTTGRRAHRWRR